MTTSVNRLRVLIAVVCFFCSVNRTFALDNPDSPNYVDEFSKRAEVYETRIAQSNASTKQYGTAFADYESFLDKELNNAYERLIGKLTGRSRDALQRAQRDWIKFRDSEFNFITTNWNQENFGSSSMVSRGDYRTTLIKQRVTSLLYYLQNYSP